MEGNEYEIEIEQAVVEAFPFEPYSIQRAFSSNLYKALSTKKLGIFESPTGTVTDLPQPSLTSVGQVALDHRRRVSLAGQEQEQPRPHA